MELADKLKTLKSDRPPLDIYQPDDCCGMALFKALHTDSLKQKSEWTHEKCGCRWQARQMADGSRHWYPVVEVWIF